MISFITGHQKRTPQIKVIYGRPKAKDDKVFGTQVPFGRFGIPGAMNQLKSSFIVMLCLETNLLKQELILCIPFQIKITGSLF